ncbi:MAG: DUF6398 domain-containing protein, partial [candidate division KSB1 bacterium]|nr:DUF6398 domain-containing protein [candidate division KSB1 bacterium]
EEGHPFLKRMIEHTFAIHLDSVRDDFENYKNENRDAEDRSNQIEPPPVFPLDGTLSEWEKLKLLQSKMPQMPFAKTMPPDLQQWSLAERIRTVNLWETAYDNYIETLIGGIDWEKLRQELEISISNMPLEGFPAEVETLFLAQMPSRGYDEEHLQLARRLWREYIVIKDYQILPKGKPETWAAGVEYLIGALCYDRDPQQQVATNYGVSTASLAARYKELKETLNLEIFTHEFDKHLSHIADLLKTVIKT